MTLTCDSKAHRLQLSAFYSEIKRKEVLIHDSRDEPGPRKHEANWMKPDTEGHILLKSVQIKYPDTKNPWRQKHRLMVARG